MGVHGGRGEEEDALFLERPTRKHQVSMTSQTGVWPKNSKAGGNGGIRGSREMGGGGGKQEGCGGWGGRSTRKLQVSIKFQTGVMAKKLKKGDGKGGCKIFNFT